ncbi:MAG: cation diffusion facilitator family transporter [Oscillospiraceae bacterium]
MRKDNVSTAPEMDFEKTAVKVSTVSIVGNVLLSLFKLLAGIFANSGAMVSDAVHSASDVISSIIVIIGVKLSARDSDDEHPYGHERMECVAAIVLAVILLITGLFIGSSALENIIAGNYEELAVPGILALAAAIASIVVKEAMFHYTKYYAIKLDSGAVMADAWHHRSDALSSIGALIGIAGSRMGLPVLDSVASLVICLFIVKAAYDIFKDAIDKMVDHACDKETEQSLRECVLAQDGVLGVDMLTTRVFGNKIYADIEISADGSKTLRESHEVAEKVHDTIERNFPKVKHIMVHVNPADDTLIPCESSSDGNTPD